MLGGGINPQGLGVVLRIVALIAACSAMMIAACSANDRESCLAEAALKPTDMGVRVAVAQCNRKFPSGGYGAADKPWEEYQRQPGGMFDDILPDRRPDFMQQMLPITSTIFVLILGVAGLMPWPIAARVWLLRGARWLCALGIVTQAVWIMLGRSPALPPAVLWVSIGILAALFVAAGELINWMHRRKFGVDHPTFGGNPWAL